MRLEEIETIVITRVCHHCSIFIQVYLHTREFFSGRAY